MSLIEIYRASFMSRKPILTGPLINNALVKMVELRRIELLTPCMPCKCSPS